MARSKKFAEPIQARLSLPDFEKFVALQKEMKITSGELARTLLSKSLAEVKING